MKLITNKDKKRKELVVSHDGKEIRFADFYDEAVRYNGDIKECDRFFHDMTSADFGLGYADSARTIDKLGLIRPTSSQIASLVRELARDRILPFSEDRSLFEFTENFYTGNDFGKYSNGIFLYDNLHDEPLSAKREDLIARLESGDKSVRFVKNEYGKHYSDCGGCLKKYEDLISDSYMIARYGVMGAQTIATAMKDFKHFKPAICLLTNEKINRKEGDKEWYDGFSINRASSLDLGGYAQEMDYTSLMNNCALSGGDGSEVIPLRIGIKGTDMGFSRGIAFGIIPEKDWGK